MTETEIMNEVSTTPAVNNKQAVMPKSMVPDLR